MTANEHQQPEVLQTLMPFARTLGVLVTTYGRDEVRGQMEWSEALCTAGGVLHGGAIMALADSTGAACAFLNLPEHATGTTTIESKTNFLRAVRGGWVEAVTRPVHVGRTVIMVETDIRDDQERLVARTTQSQLVMSA
jgi:1,4-dihydroxy-2-naphthoyl-CoA hydrolase